MSPHPNASTALARSVVDELTVRGVRLLVLSPGSRSAAIAIAASQHPDLDVRVVIDERSAAFHALGASKASRLPTAVLSTSGTAPANFYPAVVEADLSCVPLVAISADRPAEMQGIGANQTIDQVELFGSKVRGYRGIEAPNPGEDGNELWRHAVAWLVERATGSRPGPVHLNVRFREPTVPVSNDGRTETVPYVFETPRLVGGTSPEPAGVDGGVVPQIVGGRGVVVAGDGDYDREALLDRADELGWPVLATAASGLRGRDVISSYHHLLSPGVPSALWPDTVVSVGATGPSERLGSLISAAGTRVRVDRWGRSIDPQRNATDVHGGDVLDVLAIVEDIADRGWVQRWHEADVATRRRIDTIVGADDAMTGAAIALALNEVGWSALAVASSLPIREVDAHLRRTGPMFANRGASGIDGLVSMALGVASVVPGTLAYTGDLSLLHDSNGFLHDGSIDLTIVVADNHGGGLFDSLPQAEHSPDYERLFVTDPRRSLSDFARFHHLRYTEAHTVTGLIEAAGGAVTRSGVELIRVPVDRAHDRALRAQLDG